LAVSRKSHSGQSIQIWVIKASWHPKNDVGILFHWKNGTYIMLPFACAHNFLSSCLPSIRASNLLLPHLPGAQWGRLEMLLTLMCQDCLKWGDSLNCHNFDHRITPKRAILWSFLKPINFGAKKKSKISWTGWLVIIESPQKGWFYENASSGT
jgi:hypothetical protein